MSQMASKSMPMFFVNLLIYLSFHCVVGFVCHRFYLPSALPHTPAIVLSV
jgi:hypothetical protein